MTTTNMCSNFGGKWDSPPKRRGGERLEECTFILLIVGEIVFLRER